jgi:proteasome lid subunit RPN8/RPN11
MRRGVEAGLVIPSHIRRALEEHAREEAPNEACGLVLLREGQAERYVRGRNVLESPYRFELEVDPEVWFLEDEGYDLAVFHSHPASPPRPSRTDVERIGLWEGRLYLILRLDTGELAAWRIGDGEFEAERLVLLSEP